MVATVVLPHNSLVVADVMVVLVFKTVALVAFPEELDACSTLAGRERCR